MSKNSKLIYKVIIITAITFSTIVLCQCNILYTERHSKIKEDSTHLITALFSYYNDKGVFPKEDEGLDILVPEYIASKERIIDRWGYPYMFKIDSADGNFHRISIISLGADNKIGGVGKDTDEIVSEDFN